MLASLSGCNGTSQLVQQRSIDSLIMGIACRVEVLGE
jgi:hypothetical protein